jgi:hypothetical protein
MVSSQLGEGEGSRLMSGNSLVIDRHGSGREFVPAVDESVYRKGSYGNKALETRRMQKEWQEKVQQVALECTEMINKNNVSELVGFLRTLPGDMKLN